MSAAKLTRERTFAGLVRALGVTFALRKPLHLGRSIFVNRWAARSKRFPRKVGHGSTKYLALYGLVSSIADDLWLTDPKPRQATRRQQRQVDKLLAELNASVPKLPKRVRS